MEGGASRAILAAIVPQSGFTAFCLRRDIRNTT
jgi:hypothetical protein